MYFRLSITFLFHRSKSHASVTLDQIAMNRKVVVTIFPGWPTPKPYSLFTDTAGESVTMRHMTFVRKNFLPQFDQKKHRVLLLCYNHEFSREP